MIHASVESLSPLTGVHKVVVFQTLPFAISTLTAWWATHRMKQAVLLIKLESVTLNTDCACTRRVPTTNLTGLSPRLELFPTVQVRQSITQPSQIKVLCYLLYLAVLICQGCAYWRGQGLLRFRNGEFWTLCVRAFMFFFFLKGGGHKLTRTLVRFIVSIIAFIFICFFV